jgi:hypothetical protein
MTLTIQNFDGAVALDDVQQIQQALGTGVTSGCAPSLPSSTSPITVDVASGTAYVANSEVAVSAGSITLPDGDPQYPRKDVVYVDSTGALQSIQGTPRAPKSGTPAPGTDRHVYQPEPPDLSSLSSVADAAVVAEIWVPANATGTGDMTDTGVTYVRDRRLRPWAASVLTSGSISESDLSFDTATQSELDSHAGTADAHHTKTPGYTDEDAQDAVGQTVTDGIAYDDTNNETGLDIVATGSVSLSAGGSATVDTGVSASTTATFSVYLGPTNTSQDADVAAEIRNDSGTGTYVIEIEETDTSVGPTVEYDLVRAR